jgi:hypothetical protein
MSSIVASLIPERVQMKDAVGLAENEESEIREEFSCNICMSLVYDPCAC